MKRNREKREEKRWGAKKRADFYRFGERELKKEYI